MEFLGIALGVLSPITVGIFMYFFSRGQKLRETAIDRLADARREESVLQMGLQNSTTALALVVAITVLEIKPNERLESCIEDCETARKAYFDLINRTAKEALSAKK